MLRSLLVFVLMLLSAPPVHACSYTTCSQGFVLPAGNVIPPNAPALLWEPRGHLSFDEQSESDVRLRRSGGNGPDEEVLFSLKRQEGYWLILPEHPFSSDSEFVFEANGFACRYGDTDFRSTNAAFRTASDSSPLPTTLGYLRACGRQLGRLELPDSASCRREHFAAQIPIAVELSEEAGPWLELLMFSTTVDGEPWTPSHGLSAHYAPGSSWEGRGVDLLYSRCSVESDSGLTVGTHRVQMHARLPGTDIVLSTNEIEVEISCDDLTDEELSEASCETVVLPEASPPMEENASATVQSSCSIRDRASHQWQAILIFLALLWRTRRHVN